MHLSSPPVILGASEESYNVQKTRFFACAQNDRGGAEDDRGTFPQKTRHFYYTTFLVQKKGKVFMVVFISGASRGIGAAMALHFAALGYDVAVNGAHDAAALDDIAKKTGGLALFGDVADYDTVKGFFDKIIATYGQIDIIINNAGISHIGFFADMTENEWHRLINVNLGGVINCCHAALPHMLSRGKGNIVNISSIWGEAGASCEAVYSATKGGVNAFTKALAKELGSCAIRANAISCGVINTGMNSFLSKQELDELVSQIALGRVGQPHEVALVAEYLINAEYVTGQIIGLDGGGF